MRIVTQVVDGAYGNSAAGLRARLSCATGNAWSAVAEAETDGDGCVKEWHSRHLKRGLYRIVFDSDGYFARLGVASACSGFMSRYLRIRTPRTLALRKPLRGTLSQVLCLQCDALAGGR